MGNVFEITVNNRVIDAEPGETILSALKRVGIRVPTLCHMSDMMPTGACRICIVEVEGEDGLVPSCSYPVQEGMRIWTNSQKVINARKTLIQLLLSNHPDDCLYCSKSSDCQLRSLAEEYGVRERTPKRKFREKLKDITSPSIIRDPTKCILCGKCVRVCCEVQQVSAIDFVGRGSRTVVSPAFNRSMNISSCVNCGQCVLVCPTGALTEHSQLEDIINVIGDHEKYIVIQHAPSVALSIAEEFGLKPGADIPGLLNAALRQIGFARVFDTSFAADLTAVEEAHELINRLRSGDGLPMFTSCSPSWVKFVEEFYPEFIPNLSTCKSPQGMLGAVIKTFFARQAGIPSATIYSVAAMPCTAKKFEATRAELGRNDDPDIDAVITVRELLRMIKLYGIDFNSLQPEPADNPFGTRSTAGKLFGVTGGVAEATLRTTHRLLTGRELKTLKIEAVRGLDGIKEATIKMGDQEIGVAVVSGLGNTRKLLDEIKAGLHKNLKFVEVMACPGGCIAGGGQPFSTNPERIKNRMQALYALDQSEHLRTAHENPEVKRLYSEFLGEPGGDAAQAILHTAFAPRDVYI